MAPEPVAPEPVLPQPVPAASQTAKARVLADRWHVGFTDVSGGQGMLGQVEGRTGDDVAYWLATQPAAWRDRVRYVAIDMCTVFVSAVRRILPHAQLVVDHFHVWVPRISSTWSDLVVRSQSRSGMVAGS